MVKIQPFGDRVLVKLLEIEEKQIGGLVIASTVKTKSNRGVVEAVGEGTTLPDGTIKPLSVKIGDKVILASGVGMSYSTGTDEYKVVNIREVIGKIVEGEE